VRAVSPARLIVLDPPSVAGVGDGVNVIVGGVAPLAPSSVGGVALDSESASAVVDSLVYALRPGGRMIGPGRVSLPEGLTELVRDDEMWVAERLRDDVIPLRRRKLGKLGSDSN
jgi:protein-L-isoaspartate O-methyltransferase